MSGRSVLDEAIAGSGRLGDLHHELEALQHAMGDPARADEMDSDPRPLRRGAGGVRPQGRLRARGAGPRGPPRPRLRRRTDRWRRRRPLRRLEDARGDGARPPRSPRRAPDGRAHEPPRHRVDSLARGFPEVVRGRPLHDLARPRVHEPHRDAHRRDRRGRDHRLLGQLRLLRAGARTARHEPRGGLRTPAGDAREGAALHRALLGARRQGRAGAEPREGAREDREGPCRRRRGRSCASTSGGPRARATRWRRSPTSRRRTAGAWCTTGSASRSAAASAGA